MDDRALYHAFLKLTGSRECALNLMLVKMGFKDAATVRYNKKIATFLKNNGFIFELDKSYLEYSIHGFFEQTTKTPSPGATVVRRLYVGKDISRAKLKQLTGASNFGQGLAFGFPVCDIINFCRKAKNEKKTFTDIFKDWLGGLPSQDGVKFIDFRFVGGILKYLQPIRIIVHIPCKSNCPESLQWAERNLSVLEELDPVFKKFTVKEFNKPIFLYGNSWEQIGIIQFDSLRKYDSHTYAGRCSAALPGGSIIPRSRLEIAFVPHKMAEIFINGKKTIQMQSDKSLPWSYTFISPYDSLKNSPPQGLRLPGTHL